MNAKSWRWERPGGYGIFLKMPNLAHEAIIPAVENRIDMSRFERQEYDSLANTTIERMQNGLLEKKGHSECLSRSLELISYHQVAITYNHTCIFASHTNVYESMSVTTLCKTQSAPMSLVHNVFLANVHKLVTSTCILYRTLYRSWRVDK